MQLEDGKTVVALCSNLRCKFTTKDLCGRPCLQCGSPTIWYCRECYQPITNRFARHCSACGCGLKY